MNILKNVKKSMKIMSRDMEKYQEGPNRTSIYKKVLTLK